MKYAPFVIGTALGLVTAVPALSQQYPGATDLGRFNKPTVANSVYQRPRPEFEAEPLTAGEFIIRPSLVLGGYYNDNVFASENQETGSFVAFAGPRIEAETDQGIYTLRGSVGAGISRFERDSNQNSEEFNATIGGDYRVSPIDTATGTVAFNRVVVNRDDVDEGGGGAGDEPRIVHRWSGLAGYMTNFGIVDVNARVRAVDHDFQQSFQRDQDRRTYDGRVQLGYPVTRLVSAFAAPSFEIRDFDTSVDDGGFARDAERVGAEAGVVYRLGDKAAVQGSVGASHWSFDDSRFDSKNVWSVAGDLGWNITPVTTLKSSVSRREVPTTTAGASLREIISVGIGAEQEFRRDIIGFVEAEFEMSDFNRIRREDDNYRLAVGGEYFLSSTFSFSGRYTFTERDSNINTNDFTRNIVWLAVQVGF